MYTKEVNTVATVFRLTVIWIVMHKSMKLWDNYKVVITEIHSKDWIERTVGSVTLILPYLLSYKKGVLPFHNYGKNSAI